MDASDVLGLGLDGSRCSTSPPARVPRQPCRRLRARGQDPVFLGREAPRVRACIRVRHRTAAHRDGSYLRCDGVDWGGVARGGVEAQASTRPAAAHARGGDGHLPASGGGIDDSARARHRPLRSEARALCDCQPGAAADDQGARL